MLTSFHLSRLNVDDDDADHLKPKISFLIRSSFLFIFFFVKLFGQNAAGLALAFHSTFFLEGVLLYSTRPGGVARQLRDCSSRNLLPSSFFFKFFFPFF